MIAMFIAALLVTVIGIAPLIITRQPKKASAIGLTSLVILTFAFWSEMPSTVWPLFGLYGGCILGLWVIGAIGHAFDEDTEGVPKLALVLIGAGIVTYLGIEFFSSSMLRSSQYARLVGPIEQKEWTQDVQPKDPHHVRLVPLELAYYLATKQLGDTHKNIGVLGSQFQINGMTLQMIHGELWYVGALDFKNYRTWSSADATPGYVMVHAEDPRRTVVLKTDEKIVYSPGACFSKNLERHLWYSYYNKGLTETLFEIDEEGKPWWVVTVFEPTIGWSGEKVLGVVIVNPTTGDHKFYALNDVPSWVDRVIPGSFVEQYVDWNGRLSGGWLNSWWGKKNLTQGEHPSISYGSDGNPYWVLDVTSDNANDHSMVGLIYINSRTGSASRYRASGGTSTAVIDLVNNKVGYRKLHGSSPVLYNISGTMTAIVPLLGESHSYQGVALVDVANMQLAVDDDVLAAFRHYEHIVTSGGQNLAPEKQRDVRTITGIVDRFVPESRGGDTYYFLYLSNMPRIFTGMGDISPKLRLTKPGDTVSCSFIDSGEDTLQLTTFDNSTLVVSSSKLQTELRTQVAARVEGVRAEQDSKSLRGNVQNMSDAELRALMKQKKN